MADDKPKLVVLADAKRAAEKAAEDILTADQLSVEKVLEMAREEGLSDIIVIGWPKDKTEYFFATSQMDGAEVNWLLDKVKLDLLNGNF